jgi:hypothetical protein
VCAPRSNEKTRKTHKRFLLKEGSAGAPDMHLGAKLRKVTLENGAEAWSMSPCKQVQEAMKNVKNCLQENISPELGTKDATHCMSQIGALHWMVELGQVDIITEVSLLGASPQLACPRDGHLEAVHPICACLDNEHNFRMVFDPTCPAIDMSLFKECNWCAFHGKVKEPKSPAMPQPRGKGVERDLFAC